MLRTETENIEAMYIGRQFLGTLVNSHFQRNFAHSGGALCIDGVVMEINSMVFIENKAEGKGGALRLSQAAVVSLGLSIFEGNTTMHGGPLEQPIITL